MKIVSKKRKLTFGQTSRKRDKGQNSRSETAMSYRNFAQAHKIRRIRLIKPRSNSINSDPMAMDQEASESTPVEDCDDILMREALNDALMSGASMLPLSPETTNLQLGTSMSEANNKMKNDDLRPEFSDGQSKAQLMKEIVSPRLARKNRTSTKSIDESPSNADSRMELLPTVEHISSHLEGTASDICRRAQNKLTIRIPARHQQVSKESGLGLTPFPLRSPEKEKGVRFKIVIPARRNIEEDRTKGSKIISHSSTTQVSSSSTSENEETLVIPESRPGKRRRQDETKSPRPSKVRRNEEHKRREAANKRSRKKIESLGKIRSNLSRKHTAPIITTSQQGPWKDSYSLQPQMPEDDIFQASGMDSRVDSCPIGSNVYDFMPWSATQETRKHSGPFSETRNELSANSAASVNVPAVYSAMGHDDAGAGNGMVAKKVDEEERGHHRSVVSIAVEASIEVESAMENVDVSSGNKMVAEKVEAEECRRHSIAPSIAVESAMENVDAGAGNEIVAEKVDAKERERHASAASIAVESAIGDVDVGVENEMVIKKVEAKERGCHSIAALIAMESAVGDVNTSAVNEMVAEKVEAEERGHQSSTASIAVDSVTENVDTSAGNEMVDAEEHGRHSIAASIAMESAVGDVSVSAGNEMVAEKVEAEERGHHSSAASIAMNSVMENVDTSAGNEMVAEKTDAEERRRHPSAASVDVLAVDSAIGNVDASAGSEIVAISPSEEDSRDAFSSDENLMDDEDLMDVDDEERMQEDHPCEERRSNTIADSTLIRSSSGLNRGKEDESDDSREEAISYEGQDISYGNHNNPKYSASGILQSRIFRKLQDQPNAPCTNASLAEVVEIMTVNQAKSGGCGSTEKDSRSRHVRKVNQQGRSRKVSAQSRKNILNRDVRAFAKLLQGEKPWRVPSEAKLQRFLKSKLEKDGPRIKKLRLDLESNGVSTAWNKQAARVFSDAFLEQGLPEWNADDHDDIVKAFMTHLITIKSLHSKAKRAPEGDPIVEERVAIEVSDKLREEANDQRRRNLCSRRYTGCKNYAQFDPLMAKMMDNVWVHLDADCMSGDEIDYSTQEKSKKAGSSHSKRSIVCIPSWRNNVEFGPFARVCDALYYSTRFDEAGKVSAGRFPFERVPSSRVDSSSTFPKMLPSNFYDQRKIEDLKKSGDLEVRLLRMQPPESMIFSKEVLRIAARYLHIKDRTSIPLPSDLPELDAIETGPASALLDGGFHSLGVQYEQRVKEERAKRNEIHRGRK